MKIIFIFFLVFSCSQTKVGQNVKSNSHGIKIKRLINPVKNHKADITKGQALYQKYCLDCHGPQGKGDGVMAQDNDLSPANLQELVKDVPDFDLYVESSSQNSSMPGWLHSLKPDELHNLSHYIQTFRD